MLQDFNHIHNNLKFTMEFDKDKKLNFLNITIKNTGRHFKFAICRKPTTKTPSSTCSQRKWATFTYTAPQVRKITNLYKNA
jgi:hypothetical protein